jgi:diaminopimelate epimerase
MPTRESRRKPLSDACDRGRPFLKMHGLRNHFVIVDGRAEPFRPKKDEVARLCDPAVGIGADQLVVIERPPDQARAAAFVRFWNRDGGEIESCGNATRCVAWLLLEEAGANEVTLETGAGLLPCRRAGAERVSAGMGRIATDWRDVPLSEERDTCHLDIASGPLADAASLSVGNPHAVFFVDDVDALDLARLAPPIQNDPLFPEGVNVGAAQMLSENRLRLRVFERGAGLTMACGSGACAAVFAALWRGLTDCRSMTVELPGGALDIEILPDGSAVMTGPVEFAFSGCLPQ